MSPTRDTVLMTRWATTAERELAMTLLDERDAAQRGCSSLRLELEDWREQTVSRALVEKALEVLNAGPGSAGIARALGLLREALAK